MAHLLQLLLTSVVVSQVVFQQCCDATDVPVVVTSVSRFWAVHDIAVDRDNNLLYVAGYCVYRLASNGASAQVIAGSSTTPGTADGVGGAARFGSLYGLTCDTVNNIAYISDSGNYRIRALDLTNNNVTTLAGSSNGYQDGIGVAAQFSGPLGIVHYLFNVGMVLFVAESEYTGRIRRIVVASATVTSLAQATPYCISLCISRDGSSLFVGAYFTVVRISTSTNAIVTLAGSGSFGSTDGTSARFNFVSGIALNRDETALIVSDCYNNLVRRVELSSNTVSTIAGNTTRGLVDGPGLSARFYNPWGCTWYCNTTSSLCGLLIADTNNGAIRFVAVELLPTQTAELSIEATASVSRSSTMPLPGSLTASPSELVTTSATASLTVTPAPTMSRRRNTQTATALQTGTRPASSLTSSSTLSPTPTSIVTVSQKSYSLSRSATALRTLSVVQSASHSHIVTPSVAVEVTATARTPSPSHTSLQSATFPPSASLSISPTGAVSHSPNSQSASPSFQPSRSLLTASPSPAALTSSRKLTPSALTRSQTATASPSELVTTLATESLTVTPPPTMSRRRNTQTATALQTGTRPASSLTSSSTLSPTPTSIVTVSQKSYYTPSPSHTSLQSATFPPDSTISTTPLVSISPIVPVYINVTGDIFDSVVGEFISSGGKNETTLVVVAALDRNVVSTRRAYFSTPKVTALQTNGGVVSVRLRLLPQLTMRFSLTGQRVALGTEGLTATVVNQTDLLLSMRATGSQYLATVANVNIPLANLLAGNVRVTGSTELPIQFVLTATTVTALTVSTSIASVTGPFSAIAGTTPASAMAVLRLSILIDILQCGFGGDDGGANLFSLTIGPSPGSSLRGAVVGNLVFIAAFAALLGILILVFLAYGWVTLNAPPGAMLPDLLNIFHFPGIVLIPVTAVCQPTLTAAVQLIAIAPLNGDVTFGVLGAVALLLVLMLPYTVVIVTQFCLRLVEKSDNSGAHKQHAAQPPSLPRRIVSILFSERATWQPFDPTRPDQVAWKKRFAPVFLDCSVWWYPLVDLWSGAAVGVVGGLTLGNTSVCLFQLAVVAFSYAFIALLQLAVAPPLVFASRCYVVMLQVLGLISCGAVLAAAVTNDNEEDSTSVAVASISMLLIAVLSTVKSALDVLFLLIAIPGRVRRAAGVGALHCVPSPMSSPGDSFHRRGSAVELMLYDAVEEDELGPMMFGGGDVMGRREDDDEEEVHHNPITEYVNPTSVEEPQPCSRIEKSSFRRSTSVKGMKQQQHHHVDESTGSLAGGTQHDDNLVMSQTTSSLQRMTSDDHIVVNITDATTSEGVSDVSHGGGVTRRGSALDHQRPKKPARPLSAAQHAPTRFDDPFGDNPIIRLKFVTPIRLSPIDHVDANPVRTHRYDTTASVL